MKLTLTDVSCGYGQKRVVEGVSAQVASGDILCLLGPNGVGKTTLLKCLLRNIPLLAGTITADGRDIRTFSTKAYARLLAYVPQTHTPPFAFRVHDVIGMGRTAHQGMTARLTAEDARVVEECMARLRITDLSERIYTELSGGERQMVLIARALAQEPAFLLMDEPMSSLDFGNQARTLSVIRTLKEQGLAIVMTTHHPDHAFALGATAALLMPSHEFCMGSANEVLTEERLSRAYGVDVAVLDAAYQGGMMRLCRPVL